MRLSSGGHGYHRQDHLLQGDAAMLEAVFVLLLVLAVFCGVDEVIVLFGYDVGGGDGIAGQSILHGILDQKRLFGITVQVVSILISQIGGSIPLAPGYGSASSPHASVIGGQNQGAVLC